MASLSGTRYCIFVVDGSAIFLRPIARASDVNFI